MGSVIARRSFATLGRFFLRYDGVIVILVFSLAAFALPLGSVLHLGGDEPTEFTKAYLVTKGYRLYTDIWNDQPPLHTVFLASALSVFGPHLWVGRLIGAFFGLLLIVSMYSCVKLVSGRMAAAVAALWLYTAPDCLSLLHAAMLEPAAISVGLASIWLALIGTLRGNLYAFAALSGAVLGLALQIKYTALLIGFAGTLVVSFPECVGAAPIPLNRRLISSAVWATSCASVFLLLGSVLPAVDFVTVLNSHTSTPTGESSMMQVPPRHLVMNWEFWTIVVGAVGTAAIRKTKAILLPLVLLLTGGLVHALHRPWWYYYFLHSAIPLAWLCGTFVHNIVQRFAGLTTSSAELSGRILFRQIIAGLIVCSILAGMVSRYIGESRKIRSVVERTNCKEVQMLRAYVSYDELVYTRHQRYTFAAGLVVPPSLCVLAAKRYWSGAISEDLIRAEVLKLRPPFMFVSKVDVDYDWELFIKTHYQRVDETDLMTLYKIKTNNRE